MTLDILMVFVVLGGVIVLLATDWLRVYFMSTMAIVALLLPAVMDLSRRTGHAPSRLLMPLAFGAPLGGLTTMFATLPNLLASTALRDAGLRPFGIFDFLPVGGAAALAGIVYMAILGRRFLPVRRLTQETALAGGVNLRDSHRLHERMFVLRLPPGSSLEHRTLEESLLGSALGLHVVGILRDGQTQLAPDRSAVLRKQHRLLIQGRPEQLDDLQAWRGLVIGPFEAGLERWLSADVEFVEMRLSEQSRFVGQTLAWLDARRSWGANILAIRRGATVRRSHLREWRLEAGDVLLAVLVAAVVMVLGGCLRLDEAYAAIEWRAVVLIGGMLPLAAALDQTGAATLLAGKLMTAMQGASPRVILAVLFGVTALAAGVMPSAALVVLMAPITLETAAGSGLSPHAAMMTVALAASSAFNSPVSNPANVLIMGPGGYRFVDFLKAGPPLTLLVLAVVLLVLPWVWPLAAR